MSSSYAEAGPLERALVLGFAVLVFGSIGFMYWWFGRDEAAPPPDGGPVVVATASPSPSPSVSASVSAAAEPTAPANEPAATATAPPSDPTVDPTAEPVLTPTPEPDEELAELRASSRFLELAEHDRAQGARWSQFGYELFAPRAEGSNAFEWENKAELWDTLATRFRDDCLLAGEPADRPLWETRTNVESGIAPAWSNEVTGGRGQFIRFDCSLQRPDGTYADQVGGALISSDAGGTGEVVAVMEPFQVDEPDYPDFDSAAQAVDDRTWAWVQEQPKVEDPAA